MTPDLSPPDAALLRLLQALDDRRYDFVTPTPATHARVVAQRSEAQSLRDVLGWSLPFVRTAIDAEIVDLLDRAGMLTPAGAAWKSRIRVSRLHGRLFLHTSYPTEEDDAVFFGPDSYRFADLLQHELAGVGAKRIVEIGAGSGVGGIVAAMESKAPELTLADINPLALRLARINAAHTGLTPKLVETSGLDGVEGEFDVIVANPPYIAGDDSQTYRDGGDLHGAELSLEWAAAAGGRLAPGGRFILYTGSAIVDGRDRVREILGELAGKTKLDLSYREIDPDVFGEELERDAYAGVERIAVVGAVLTRRE